MFCLEVLHGEFEIKYIYSQTLVYEMKSNAM